MRPQAASCAFLLFGFIPLATAEDPFPVTIHVDAAKTRGALKPIWRFFGADEPNYAYMKHGRKLVAELGALAPGGVLARARTDAAFKVTLRHPPRRKVSL